MKLFHRKPRYQPPNPVIPEFNTAGEVELWKLTLDNWRRTAALEATTKVVVALLLGQYLIMVGAIVAAVVRGFF